MKFTTRLAVALAAALFSLAPVHAQQVLRSQTVSFDNYAALKAVPEARFQAGAAAIVSDIDRSGLFIKVSTDQTTLAGNDPSECVFVDPDATPSNGGWVRQAFLDGSADINPRWCGFGVSGNTALENANALQDAIDLAAVEVVQLVANKRAVASASVRLDGGSYTMRPGIVHNRHGVTLDLGASIIYAEAGQAGALLENSDETGSFTETNRAIIRNGTLRGDTTGNFNYDATAGSIGILTKRCVRNCVLENMDVEGFDTAYMYDGTFGFEHHNATAQFCGSTVPDSGTYPTGCLVIYNGTASSVSLGRFEYTNGESPILVDGSVNGGTAALTFNDIVCQNAPASCMTLRNVDNVTVNNGDWENNNNSSDTAPEINIDRTIAGNNGQVKISGTQFIRTGAPDTADSAIVRCDQARICVLEDIFVRDQVNATYNTILELDGASGTYRISGFVLTNEASPIATTNILGTLDTEGCTDVVRINSGNLNPVRKCEQFDRMRADEVFVNQFRVELGSEVTIAAGAITVVSGESSNTIDTEADAATDDLDTITGGAVGDWLALRTVTSTRDVTIKHNTGNILMNGKVDFTLTSPFDVCYFRRETSWWINMFCADNQ